MITVAGIDDQELPITTEFASINYPAITGRSYLCGKARLDHNSLRLPTELRLFAECQRPAALRGRRQFGSGLCEGDGRRSSARGAGGVYANLVGACAKGMAGLIRPGLPGISDGPDGANSTIGCLGPGGGANMATSVSASTAGAPVLAGC